MATLKVLAVALLVLSIALPASAFQDQTKTPVVNEREKHQQQRIKEGVKSGELTGKEAKKLEKQQAKIHAEEAVAKSDGKVTKGERAKIHHDQNKASKHIYKEKHDKQDRK